MNALKEWGVVAFLAVFAYYGLKPSRSGRNKSNDRRRSKFYST